MSDEHPSATASQEQLLSLEDCIKMEDDLIKGYLSKEFQVAIWKAMDIAGNNEDKQLTARVQTCQVVQFPVMKKYGFEESRKGVSASMKSFGQKLEGAPSKNATFNDHPEIACRNAIMQYLIDPSMQRKIADQNLKAPHGIPPSRRRMPDPDNFVEDTVKMWRVVGGAKTGGIMVRSGEDTKSAELSSRLKTGAIIQEIEKNGDRVKYEKDGGDGPDFGWISISFKGNMLVEPLWQDVDFSVANSDQEWYKVVHDKVVWRSQPSKDSKMLGGSKKGESLKGTVVDKDGVQWLKTRQKGAEGHMETCYVMIDGKSVGLGKLLEKK